MKLPPEDRRMIQEAASIVSAYSDDSSHDEVRQEYLSRVVDLLEKIAQA